MNEQQFNPLAPTFSPTAAQIMGFYHNQAANLMGQMQEVAPAATEAAPQEGDQAQDKHISNLEQWLAPIKMRNMQTDQPYTDEDHENFLTNAEKHPAIAEFGDPLHAAAEQLLAAHQSGQIDDQQLEAAKQQILDSVVKPVLDKHTPKGSKNPDYHLHRKQEDQIPDVVKRVRGAK
ncbi:TPA: hypothetical protein ACXEZB_004391 [Escherichia coli]